MTTFRQLLDQFEESASTRAAKGRRFERFCEQYFRTDPLWTERFSKVWAWDDWPGRGNRADTGIDLVAEEAGTGALVAIQCKFYAPTATIDWRHISTFVAMLGQPDFESGLLVSTAGAESSNLHKNLERLEKPVNVWRVADFEESSIDWDQYEVSQPAELVLRTPKTLRDHQRDAIDKVSAGLGELDRGQMIMACGTGKTFTSLRLAERAVGPGGNVLFLVPSINLLSQTVKAWVADASTPLSTFAVCSDTRAGRSDEDMAPNDLAFPASTDAEALYDQLRLRGSDDQMTVIFSTYQSIDVITELQRLGFGRFDLAICDEAHRTTGAFKEAGDQSAFTKIHDDDLVGADKRLYMTATPRVYGDQTKAKARDRDVVVASMDDPERYGPALYELPFGEAVARQLLTDYKVLVLAVDEDAVSAAFQRQLSDDGELALDDVAKMVGCWHGLSKRGPQFDHDNIPMRRAVAFSSTIKQSKAFTNAFPAIVDDALEDRSDRNAIRVETGHVDGTTNVKVRSEQIAWLEEPPGQGVCRVLSNARCLTEGVDVPALDAVMFLQPRKSIVDVVQAVGRVMRRAPDKEYGYVILPIGIPSGTSPSDALRDNKRYQVVWEVLQALRSHDERLAAEINKIDINGRSSKVNVIGIGVAGGDDPDDPGVTTTTAGDEQAQQLTIPDLHEWRDGLYARIVEKVGDRRYMDAWAADIATIAAAQESRIRALLDHPHQHPAAVAEFDQFHTALQHNINDGVTRDDAISMLSQHLITRPVFEALFENGEFTTENPVSKVMQTMIDHLDDTNIGTETATLEGFYTHIRMLIGGIDTAEGRQRVITELYEKFFKRALPTVSESLGIVYTPVEIVDFINRSVNDLLQQHFDGASISDEGVHVLDPFTGTGTFIARLLQSGLIRDEDLARKYAGELHANEILLLGYYIGAINIETVYHTIANPDHYQPFEGIILTDTFQSAERDDPVDELMFPRNNARLDRQKQLDIRVILGNPPYSVGQTSQNDNNQNQSYPTLDESIATTYAKRSTATLKNSLYDSYIRAFRWATNRLSNSPNGGIIGFVSNGGWLDGNTAAGVRLTFTREFHDIYVYNLRGNTRTSGELARREGGQTFGPGSRNTVTITLLVKRPEPIPPQGATIHYRDIGDYLTREQKLETITASTVDNIDWDTITPNDHGDWINQRDTTYDQLIPLEGDNGIFSIVSNGLKANGDAWVYNSSRSELESTVTSMIEFYNSEVDRFDQDHPANKETIKQRADQAKQFIDRDPARFSWTAGDLHRLAGGVRYVLEPGMLRIAQYRPFFGQHLAHDGTLNERVGQLPQLYPHAKADNLSFNLVGLGNTVPFSVLATASIPDLCLLGASSSNKVFARWRFQSNTDGDRPSLLEAQGRVSNITNTARHSFTEAVGTEVSDNDIFYYTYGVLHSPAYRDRYAETLKREAPRIPLPSDRANLDAFAAAGRRLAKLHIGYESVEPYPLVEEWADTADPGNNPDHLKVTDKKMRYPKVTDPENGTKVSDRTRLIYNPHLTLTGIPTAAHDYQLGSRSPIDWIIDRYYIKTDKKSGIVNDPNQRGLEQGDPRYIIELIKRVTAVALETVRITAELPQPNLPTNP